MARKTVTFNKAGIEKLPVDKPVVYTIKTAEDKANYIGVAQRWRAQERLMEHLPNIPGAKVQIEQMSSIKEAREKEAKIIAKHQPPYNTQVK
jgi:excinuclease UvrABC nuclease subunit